jgi:hypothetical protein
MACNPEKAQHDKGMIGKEEKQMSIRLKKMGRKSLYIRLHGIKTEYVEVLWNYLLRSPIICHILYENNCDE